jgi:Ca-activated chloride channel family protein
VAAAGPDREPPEVVEVTPVDLLVAVDVSQSMSGEDVELTRIGRARLLVEQILEAQVADRVALLLFADWTYDLVPLTNDPAVISFFVPFVSPDLVAGRDQGTSLGPMFTEAVRTWQARARTDATAALLIVSDGEIHGGSAEVLAAIDSVSAAGIQVWTAGAGSAEGAPLHLPRSDAPLLDGSGRPVIAGFDPALLGEIATRGGGRFMDISDDAGIRRLIGELDDIGGRVEPTTLEAPPSSSWLLVLALILLVLESALDVGAFDPGRWLRARRRAGADS